MFATHSSWPFPNQPDVRELRDYIRESFFKSLYNSVPWSEDSDVQWEAQTVTTDTLSLDNKLWTSVLWEIHELGHRLDFIDLHLAEMRLTRGLSSKDLVEAEISECLHVFSHTGSLIPKQTDPLSVCWESTGWTSDMKHLRKFLRVIGRWPLAPPVLQESHSSPKAGVELNLEALVSDAVHFFCERFIVQFGRKPNAPVYRPVKFG